MPGPKKKTRGKSSGQLSTLNEHAAGLDVGSTFHVVAVRGDQDDEPVRTFRSFSGDLHKMADWLRSVGIKTVAMESTSVYWIPVFEILEARGFRMSGGDIFTLQRILGHSTPQLTSDTYAHLSPRHMAGEADRVTYPEPPERADVLLFEATAERDRHTFARDAHKVFAASGVVEMSHSDERVASAS